MIVRSPFWNFLVCGASDDMMASCYGQLVSGEVAEMALKLDAYREIRSAVWLVRSVVAVVEKSSCGGQARALVVVNFVAKPDFVCGYVRL